MNTVEVATFGVLMHVPEAPAASVDLETTVPYEIPKSAKLVAETALADPEVVATEARIVAGHEENAQAAMQADAQSKLAELFNEQSQN